MKTISRAVDTWAITAFALFAVATVTALGGALISEAAPAPTSAAGSPVRAAVEVVDVQLADVIAGQGNEALRQIRAEPRRLAPPVLPLQETR